MKQDEFQKTDERIADLLAENARMTFSEIGKRVGLSRVAVKNRVAALEERGVIKGYHAEIDRRAPADRRSFCAILYICSNSFGKVLNEVKSIPSIKTVYRLSGGNMIVAFGETDSERHLRNFAWRFQNRKEEIDSITVREIWSVETGDACGAPQTDPMTDTHEKQENRL